MARIIQQYRLVVWRKPRIGWRFDRDTVIEEAIYMRLAQRDPRYPGTVFWDVMVEIDVRQVAAGTVIVSLQREAA